MRRLVPLTTALALASALLVGPSAAAAPAERGERTATPFAMRASGFGTQIRGGEIPAASGATAFQALGCTNMTGIRRANYEAEATIPGLGKASGLRTSNVTVRSNGGKEVATISRHSVARLVLVESSFGRLEARAVSAYAKAFHGPKGFDSVTRTSLGTLVYTDPDGNEEELDLPTPGHPVEVPGLLRISVGNAKNTAKADRAKAVAVALVVNIIPTSSVVRVSKAAAEMDRGIVTGVFGGHSNASRASGLEGNVRTGRTPLTLMPCQGTEGKVIGKDIAGLNLGDQIVVGALRTRQMGKQNRRRATGYELSSVAQLNLGDGELVIDAIQGKVTVTRERGRARSKVSFAGTTVGQITSNGEPQAFPDQGPLVIPGVAEIEFKVTDRTNSGGSVTAIRVTLLDGSGAVLNLGQARLKISNPGLRRG